MKDEENLPMEIKIAPGEPIRTEYNEADRIDGETLDRQETEAFWAGRNHAMRRSARVAA